jgi:hypothetical protein
MADLNQTIRDDRGFVERIVQLVPGFRGYFDRENRREADHAVRMCATKKLDHIIAELHDLTKRVPLGEKDECQECVNQAEKLRHELQYADRGYSGFFSEIKWDRPNRLSAIYEFDERILGTINTLTERALEGTVPLAELRKELISLQRDVGERRNVILNLGGE